MNEQTLNLKDIHLPDPVSWWPIAPGWWLLLLALTLITAVIFISIRLYRKRQLRRDITSELEQIKNQYQQTGSRYQLAAALSILLRRAAISLYPLQHIAGLTGEQWLNWLQQTSEKNAPSGLNFNAEPGKILITAPYLDENKEPDFDADALIKLCESWLLSTHKSPAFSAMDTELNNGSNNDRDNSPGKTEALS